MKIYTAAPDGTLRQGHITIATAAERIAYGYDEHHDGITVQTCKGCSPETVIVQARRLWSQLPGTPYPTHKPPRTAWGHAAQPLWG